MFIKAKRTNLFLLPKCKIAKPEPTRFLSPLIYATALTKTSLKLFHIISQDSFQTEIPKSLNSASVKTYEDQISLNHAATDFREWFTRSEKKIFHIFLLFQRKPKPSKGTFFGGFRNPPSA